MLRIVSLWRHDPSHTIVSTRERAQSFLTDEHLQRVVRAYQDFKDEPGFTRVVPIEEIRAKEGNLSIPLYVGGETQAQTDAATETVTSALPNALAGWLESSTAVRQSLQSLLTAEKWALF
jgi:type I restriction enzyme M protein